ncbi:HEAT repeat domain-containing protein [Nocardia sp. NPDC059240]|uniref:HEAT repeat domain-containing protein n=1 Tax=Nocardia sp. NPDC059240 TaxID=3346786 RepID=UPI003690C3CE
MRWTAWLSEAPMVGVGEAELLSWGVPRAVAALVALLPQRPGEMPMDYVERIGVHPAAVAIKFVERREFLETAPGTFYFWGGAFRVLAEKLAVPPYIPPAEAPVPPPTEPGEHWRDYANWVAENPDSQMAANLLTAYDSEHRDCCRNWIYHALYVAADSPYAAEIADRWWDSGDAWEAATATLASCDIDRLRTRLADERPNVVQTAIEGIMDADTDDAEIAALGRIVRRSEIGWRWARVAAARRLRAIGGPEALAALRGRILSPIDPPWREDPGWLADRGRAHIPELIAHLGEPAWWYDAPYALGELRAIEAVPALCRSLRDDPNWVPWISALGRIGSTDAIDTLAETARTGNAEARDHSLRALARIGPSAAVAAALIALDDIEPTVRERAGRVLCRHGDQGAVPALIRLCDKPSAVVAAVRALGRIGDPRAEPTLWALFCTGAPRVRAAAGRALVEVAGPRRSLLSDAWRSDPGLRRAYLQLLGRRHDTSSRYVELSLRDGDPRVRAAAAHLVATLGLGSHREVLEGLRDDVDSRVRRAAEGAVKRLDVLGETRLSGSATG